MNLSPKNIKEILLFYKFQSLSNVKKLCVLVGFTNIITCIIFYYWLFNYRANQGYNFQHHASRNLLISAAMLHTYANMVLIVWTLSYEGAKWSIWAWLSLIFVSPLGIVLIFVSNNERTWDGGSGKIKKKISIFHSLPNSFVNLPSILNKALEFLSKTYPEDFARFLVASNLNINNFNNWHNKDKYMIIAMYEVLKQTKKKNNFKDIDFGAHWYDQRFFDFALKDPKSGIVPNLRYKYSLGFIVLDEFNNYQKILDGKKEIKKNMKFGPAKTVCLHWGKGFKVFVNE